jgi:hypothetical protein
MPAKASLNELIHGKVVTVPERVGSVNVHDKLTVPKNRRWDDRIFLDLQFLLFHPVQGRDLPFWFRRPLRAGNGQSSLCAVPTGQVTGVMNCKNRGE